MGRKKLKESVLKDLLDDIPRGRRRAFWRMYHECAESSVEAIATDETMKPRAKVEALKTLGNAMESMENVALKDLQRQEVGARIAAMFNGSGERQAPPKIEIVLADQAEPTGDESPPKDPQA